MILQAITVGPLVVRLYGLILGVAIVVGASIAASFARKFEVRSAKFKIKSEYVWDGLVWAVVLGVIGARAYHVIDLWEFYSKNPGQMLAVWNGGLGIFGAIGGGTLGLWLFSKRESLSLAQFLDVVAFGLPVAQAVGRLGNFVNQELYGKPFDFAQGKPPYYAIYISPESRLPGFEQFSHFHPLFVYEALLNLGLFGLLVLIYRKKILGVGRGKYFAIYLFGYSLIRFCLEPLRVEMWKVGVVPMAQLVSVVLMVLSLGWVIRSPKKVK